MAKPKQPPKEKVQNPKATIAKALPIPEPQAIAIDKICFNCRFLETGTWFGPRCTNPESPKFNQHMADTATCEKFTAKTQQPVPMPEDDGLYDPDVPAAVAKDPDQASLEDLLARETEAPDVQ